MTNEENLQSLSVSNIDELVKKAIDEIRYRFGYDAARNPEFVLEYVRLITYEKRTLIMREIGLSEGGE